MWAIDKREARGVHFLDFCHGDVVAVVAVWRSGSGVVSAIATHGDESCLHSDNGTDDVAASALVQGF